MLYTFRDGLYSGNTVVIRPLDCLRDMLTQMELKIPLGLRSRVITNARRAIKDVLHTRGRLNGHAKFDLSGIY